MGSGEDSLSDKGRGRSFAQACGNLSQAQAWHDPVLESAPPISKEFLLSQAE